MGFNHELGGGGGAAKGGGGPPLRKAHPANETRRSLTSHTDRSRLLHNACGARLLFFFLSFSFLPPDFNV